MYWLRDDYGRYQVFWEPNFWVPLGYQAGQIPHCNDSWRLE